VGFDAIQDPDFLRQAAKLLDAENRRLLRENLELRNRVRKLEGKEPEQLALVDELEHQVHVRNRLLFGDKSEKRGSHEEPPKEPVEKHGHGPTEQVALPVIETEHRLDDADRVCTSCGGKLEEWEGQSEDSEEIESLQRCFLVVKHRRLKYRCKCGGCVETAPGPKKLIAGGRYAPSVAVAIAVDKYADHLPLERQARIMTRQGLAIESQTLWDQLDALATHVKPAYERLLAYVRTKSVLGADETPWRLLGNGTRSSKRWYAWALCSEDAVVYRLDESRSAEAAAKIIGSFKGTLVCDGYTAYEALRKQGASIRIAHCWAHVRRKFIEAEESAPGPCKEVLDLIGKIYEVERRVREGPPEARLLARQAEAKPIVEEIRRWGFATSALPQSPLGKALGYMSSQWQGLLVFLDDPNVAPDNNAVERALRGLVLGRKNHYGSRSQRGAEVAAIFYSLVESAKLVGIDPDLYLKTAARAALSGTKIPLPHEIAAR